MTMVRTSLQVQLHLLDENGALRTAGSTVAGRTPKIPQAGTWMIQPCQPMADSDWDTLLALMADLRIPGLIVNNRQMTDTLLERISQLKHVTYLTFPGSMRVTDAGFRHLASMPQLQHLDLSCPQVTDRGLEILRQLTQLRSFKVVHHWRVSDAGLSHLADCPDLESVDFMGTGAGDGVIRALAGKSRLRQFVPGSKTTDAGLALLHEFPMFKSWHGSDAARSANAMGSPSALPTYLFLNLRAPVTDHGIAQLAGLEGLSTLTLYGWSRSGPFDARNSAVTPAGVTQLARLPHLRSLGCFDPLCTDEVVRVVCTMPSIRSLGGVTTSDGFEAVSRSKSLEFIGGSNINGERFTALAGMPALRELGLNLSSVDDESLSSLARFQALRTIGPGGVPDAGYRHIGRCEKLESLSCMYCWGITDAATEHLAGLAHLKNYEAWGLEITDRTLEILSRMHSLERILISDKARVTDAGLAAIARLPRLKEVVLEALANVSPNGPAVFPEHVDVNIVTGEA